MISLKKYFTARRLNKGYEKWLNENPSAMEQNEKILKEIANQLGEQVSQKEILFESIEISPSNHSTKQIVIRATPKLIKLIDKFLIDNGVVAIKELNCLRIDYLP